MHRIARLASPLLVVAGLSCSSSGSQSAPPAQAPAPAPAPAAASGREGGPPGGRMGQAGGRGGRPQLTPAQRAARRDSIAALRADYVKQVMAKIAGHETEPAGEVFNNVVLMKDMTAGDFVKEMDQNFGYALSANCTSCHVAGQWDDDSRANKKRARIMIEMVDVINKEQLTKMPAGRSGQTPTITCVTCHRGNGNPGRALLP